MSSNAGHPDIKLEGRPPVEAQGGGVAQQPDGAKKMSKTVKEEPSVDAAGPLSGTHGTLAAGGPGEESGLGLSLPSRCAGR